MSVNKDLIAPCGIHCEPCPLFKANEDPELRARLASRFGIPEERAKCNGCRPSKGSPMPLRGKLCPTYSCNETRGQEYCHECADMPCGLLYPTVDGAEYRPHNTKIASLLVMKRDGVESWAAQYPRLQQLYFKSKMEIGHGPRLVDEES